MGGSGDGYGMGSGMGGGYGYGMGMGYGGMGSDMDDGEWPERCRSFCIYKKMDSYDDRMFCFARSSNSQSMCMRDDGEKPINVSEWEGYGYGYGYGMGSGSGIGSGSGMDHGDM